MLKIALMDEQKENRKVGSKQVAYTKPRRVNQYQKQEDKNKDQQLLSKSGMLAYQCDLQ